MSIGRAAGLIGALGLASVLSASSASAQVTADATNAINAKLRSLSGSVLGAYFQNPVSRAPLAGRTGGGAYQTFRGTTGAGAIYYSPSTKAHIIYGNILTFFNNNGMEDEFGYPTNDPISGNGASYGCESDTTVFQPFSQASQPVRGQVTPRAMEALCANARGRVTRGTITFSGANTPVVGGVSRNDGRKPAEDDGRGDVEEEDARASEEDADVPSRSSGTGSRSAGSRSGSGILTPR